MTVHNHDFIPQANPGAGYLSWKAEIDAAIQKVLESGWYILGEEVKNFENEFASYIGIDNAIGVASGTDAIEIALLSCDIGLGDLVFTVSHTAVATVAAIVRCGATPVLVDINPATFTMVPDCLEEAIIYQKKNNTTCRPKAIIPVHLYGHPADMSAVMDIAARNHLLVIEDCAQAHGAICHSGQMTEIRGQKNRESNSLINTANPIKKYSCKVGSIGDIGCFSFYPTKNLGALGDGGMVVTNNKKLANKVKALREYGWRERYISDFPGMNTRLDELQAAILRIKLCHLDESNTSRSHLASLYHQGLASTDLVLPTTRQGAGHVYHQFVVRSAQRDVLQAYLKLHGVGTAIHYPMPVHMQPAYKEQMIVHGTLPESERAACEILSLPLYPELSDEAVNVVIDEILNFHQQGNL